MIEAIIIDDENDAISALEYLIIKYCPEIKIVGRANSVKEAYELIELVKPDLLFLDIEMPNHNGFNLLEKYDEYPFSIIFVTAYNDYAIKAIRFSALDYLLKPVDDNELRNAVKRATLEKERSNVLLTGLKKNIQNTHDNVRL